jgi:hypothetical protein
MARTPPTTPRQLAPHQHLDRVLTGEYPPGHYKWHHVLGVLHAVTSTRTARHEAVLRRVARHTRGLDIEHEHGSCHAMPPEELLRCIAVRTLADWDHEGHESVIREVAGQQHHDIAAQVARDVLRRRSGR